MREREGKNEEESRSKGKGIREVIVNEGEDIKKRK